MNNIANFHLNTLNRCLMNSVVHFVSNPTVIELKVKILYVICFAFSFQLNIFHNIKVDLL